MKRFIPLCVALFFLAVLAGSSFAQLAEKKQELDKVRKYVESLDKKIVSARSARRITKLTQLKELKRDALQRAKKLKAEIAGLEKPQAPAAKPAAKPSSRPKAKVAPSGAKRKQGYQAGIAYAGGGALLEGGYYLGLDRFDLEMTAGLGLGNGYSVLAAGLAAVMPFDAHHAGLGLGLANFSETIGDVPGAGTINKGMNIGVGFFVGTKLEMFLLRAGYNSALGLTLGAVYKF